MTKGKAHSPARIGPRPGGTVTMMVDAAGVVVAAIELNVLWLLGTLAGLGVLGAGPATVAVATVARGQIRGDLPPMWRNFWRSWRENLVAANLAYAPLAVAAFMAVVNLGYFTRGPLAWLAWPAGVFLLAVLGLATLWVAPLMAHYDLPTVRYSMTALRLVVLRPLPSVLLLLVIAALAYASSRWTILIAVFSIGAAIYAATWLGVRTFDDNEARLVDPRQHATPDRQLPTEPLRMR